MISMISIITTSIFIFFGVTFKVFLKAGPIVAAIMVKVAMHNFYVHGPKRGNPNMTWPIVTLDIPSSARVVIRHFIHWYRRRRFNYDAAFSFMTLYYTSCKTQCCQNTKQANHHFPRSRGTSLTKFASHFYFPEKCFIFHPADAKRSVVPPLRRDSTPKRRSTKF
jgi:hypothetical protein